MYKMLRYNRRNDASCFKVLDNLTKHAGVLKYFPPLRKHLYKLSNYMLFHRTFRCTMAISMGTMVIAIGAVSYFEPCMHTHKKKNNL